MMIRHLKHYSQASSRKIHMERRTTIGTVEHLKNPSIKSLRDYYNSRYVPNNMAIILSGDFNPDEVIKIVDATFGNLQRKDIAAYLPAKEDPIIQPIIKEVVGPDAESVDIGFRLGGSGTREADLLKVFNMILSNSTAGLIDLNLNQAPESPRSRLLCLRSEGLFGECIQRGNQRKVRHWKR